MESSIGLQASQIISIDFDIILDRNYYAQATLQSASPRCKVYYCFKNKDTREDGEDRCSQEIFVEICNVFAELLSESLYEVKRPNIKCSIVLNMNGNPKHSFNEKNISADTLKKLINLLSDKIDEFSFLTAFKYYI